MESYVYILTNKSRRSLYVGMTADLLKRLYQHETHYYKDSFTDRYNITICVYYEVFHDINLAIRREKELKGWTREKKESLINASNPEWKVLASSRGFAPKGKTNQQEMKEIIDQCLREARAEKNLNV